MDLLEKRIAVLIRSVSAGRLDLVDALGLAVELGLGPDELAALVERCAGVTGARDRAARISALLVREYAAKRLQVDEVIALARELGLEDEEVERLIDECGAADLAA